MSYRRFATTSLATVALLLGAAAPSLSVQAGDRPWVGNQRADDDYRHSRDDRRDDRRDNRRYRNKDDNTGTVVGAVLLGAGLLYILSQAGKKKKNEDLTGDRDWNTNETGGGWNNPDVSDNDPEWSTRLSASQRRAVDICTEVIARDVRAQGGSNVTVEDITRASGNDRVELQGDWIAIFSTKDVRTRSITCSVENDRVLQYRVG